MPGPLRLLIVDDSDEDARLLAAALARRGAAPAWRRVDVPDDLRRALAEADWDVVLADHDVAGLPASLVLAEVRRADPDLPVIVVTDSAGGEVAASLMKAGAADFILKSNLVRLVPAVEREVGDTIDRRRRRAVEEELRRLAFHDPLTGLPNRASLRRRLEALPGAPVAGPAALLVVALRRMRDVNLALGHHRGDALLRAVGERLRTTFGEGAEVARLDGDHFGVLLCGPAAPADAARAAATLLEALERPYAIDGITVDVSASVGIALRPAHGTDLDALLRNAEVALLLARHSDTAHAIYTASADGFTPRRMALMAELKPAIERREFFLHYQPVVDLQSGAVVGTEALVRWKHPEHGTIPPGEFISLAEHTGAIRPLTLWVLQTALAECRRLRDAGWPIVLAVNVSARSLADPRFVAEVERLVQAAGARAGWLEFEITESVLMSDPERAQEVVARLGALGVHVSIDDFGTGYSSLGYLRRLPVHALKIDRSFLGVGGATPGVRDTVIIRAVVDVGHALGLSVVAEGIETEEALDALRALGCDRAQGFHIGRPMPGPALGAWLDDSEWGRRTTRTAIRTEEQ